MGVPYSATTARTRLRNGEVRHCEASRACPHAALPRALGRPLLRRHSSVAARPLRCQSGLFQHLVSSGGLLSAGTGVDTSLEQCVGRLNHDRTTERQWQRLGSHRATVPKEVPRGSSTPAAAHATSPKAVAVWFSSVPFHRGGRPGWSGGVSLGPLPPRTVRRWHRRIAPTAQNWRRCARRQGAGQTAGPFLVSRHPLSRRAARCWKSAGLFVGGQLACRQVTPGKPGCGLPLRGHRGPGQSVRASVLLSWVLTEAGVTPAVHLRGSVPLAASPAQPVSESGKCLQNSQCPAGRGEQTPTPVNFRRTVGDVGGF